MLFRSNNPIKKRSFRQSAQNKIPGYGTECRPLTTILKQQHGSKPPVPLLAGQPDRSTGADHATTSTRRYVFRHSFILSRRAPILLLAKPYWILELRALSSCTRRPELLSYSGSNQRQDQRLSQQPYPRLRTGKNPRSRKARPSRRDRFVTWMTLPRRRPSTTAILARPLKFAPCGSGFISAVTLKGRLYVTEFDIGEFFIDRKSVV